MSAEESTSGAVHRPEFARRHLFLNERKGRIQAHIFSVEEKQRLLAVAGGYL